MSCIDVNVTPLLPQLDENCKVTRIGDGLKASVKDIGERIIAGVRELSSRLNANVENLSTGLSVTCSVVCSIADVGHYLEVTPTEIQWITDDMGVYYDVESNVEWIIVTS